MVVGVKVWAVMFCCRGCGCRGEGMGCYVLLQGLWLQGSRYGLCSVAGVVVVRVKVWAVFCCRGCGCRGEGMGCVLLQGLWS